MLVPPPATVTSPGFSCDFCGKVFGSLHELQGHVMTAHVGRPFAPRCEICGEKFESPADLQAHHRSVHRSGG
jgi:Zinc finger, C2H2 type/C2H2-type zinc finger